MQQLGQHEPWKVRQQLMMNEHLNTRDKRCHKLLKVHGQNCQTSMHKAIFFLWMAFHFQCSAYWSKSHQLTCPDHVYWHSWCMKEGCKHDLGQFQGCCLCQGLDMLHWRGLMWWRAFIRSRESNLLLVLDDKCSVPRYYTDEREGSCQVVWTSYAFQAPHTLLIIKSMAIGTWRLQMKYYVPHSTAQAKKVN